MSIISRARKQTAVYWEPDGLDGNGQTKYKQPVQISCRWDEKVEQFLADNVDGEDEIRLSRAQVMTSVDTKVRGYLMLGTLTDVTDPDDPINNSDAFEIKARERIPNLRNSENFLRAFL